MRYRGYRRKCRRKKFKHYDNIALFSGFCTSIVRCQKEIHENDENNIKSTKRRYRKYVSSTEKADYIVKVGRGKASSYLKKLYARKLRRGKNKLVLYKGCDYKRASGDFWWDLY